MPIEVWSLKRSIYCICQLKFEEIQLLYMSTEVRSLKRSIYCICQLKLEVWRDPVTLYANWSLKRYIYFIRMPTEVWSLKSFSYCICQLKFEEIQLLYMPTEVWRTPVTVYANWSLKFEEIQLLYMPTEVWRNPVTVYANWSLKFEEIQLLYKPTEVWSLKRFSYCVCQLKFEVWRDPVTVNAKWSLKRSSYCIFQLKFSLLPALYPRACPIKSTYTVGTAWYLYQFNFLDYLDVLFGRNCYSLIKWMNYALQVSVLTFWLTHTHTRAHIHATENLTQTVALVSCVPEMLDSLSLEISAARFDISSGFSLSLNKTPWHLKFGRDLFHPHLLKLVVLYETFIRLCTVWFTDESVNKLYNHTEEQTGFDVGVNLLTEQGNRKKFIKTKAISIDSSK
jgi:hypothetical protein